MGFGTKQHGTPGSEVMGNVCVAGGGKGAGMEVHMSPQTTLYVLNYGCRFESPKHHSETGLAKI